MPITPRFSVTQNDDFVIIVIKVPHIKTQSINFFVGGQEFSFNSKPYLLRLTFPGNIVEDDRASASYDVDKGELTVTLAKEDPGQHFEDLDMLTKLLARSGDDAAKSKIKRPLIEVISSGQTLEGTELEKDEEFDWQMPQEIAQEIFTEVRYGFNNRYSGFFTHVTETANDVLDVYDPEHATLEVRRENRIQRENSKFDDEYYMSDFMIEEEIQHILDYKTPWRKELRAIQKKKASSNKPGKVSAESPKPLISTITSAAPRTTSFKTSLFSERDQATTPSLFHIVKDDSQSTEAGSLDSIGLREVSSKPISMISEINEPTSIAKPLVQPVKPMEKDFESMCMVESGLSSVKIIDPSRPSLNSNLVSDMADMTLSDEDLQSGSTPFTDKEQELMRDLPRREYILQNTKSTYLGLIDILFAYSYDLRVSEGDTNVETAWTICKLSATVAALDQFTTLGETLVACFRRSLAYPLNRNWNLSNKVMEDVYVLLKLGRRGILRALLAIKDILDHDDIYYIYSKMFIEDYCVWIQSASEEVIRTLAHEVHHYKVQKDSLGWHLEELEHLAKETPENEEEDESEEESSDSEDDDSSSDEDDSSDDEDESDSDGEESSQKKGTEEEAPEEEESIFMHEGPRPKIIEL